MVKFCGLMEYREPRISNKWIARLRVRWQGLKITGENFAALPDSEAAILSIFLDANFHLATNQHPTTQDRTVEVSVHSRTEMEMAKENVWGSSDAVIYMYMGRLAKKKQISRLMHWKPPQAHPTPGTAPLRAHPSQQHHLSTDSLTPYHGG